MGFVYLDDDFVRMVLEESLRHRSNVSKTDPLDDAVRKAVNACIKADRQIAAYQRRLSKARQRSA